MKKILLIFFLGRSITTYSQTNNLIGVWREAIQDTNSYRLMADDYCYSFYDGREFNTLYIKKFYYGFIDDNGADFFSISQFSDSGRYFVLANANLDKKTKYDKSYFLIYGTNIHSKYGDFDAIELEGPKFFMYGKIGRLNRRLEKNLKEKSPDVFAEYLAVTSRKEITTAKSIIYSQPGNPTKMYLIEDDIVKVLEEKYGWLRIEYEGAKLVTGWIRKQDVEGE
jgi:hypothetical protein